MDSETSAACAPRKCSSNEIGRAHSAEHSSSAAHLARKAELIVTSHATSAQMRQGCKSLLRRRFSLSHWTRSVGR